MKIITNYPIIRSKQLSRFSKNQMLGEGMGEYDTAGGGSYGTQYGADGEVLDNYAHKDIDASGLSITTENPVYHDTAVQAQEWLSSVSGATRRARRARRKRTKRRRGGGGGAWGGFMDKLRGGFDKFKQSGAMDVAKGVVGRGQQDSGEYAPEPDFSPIPPDPPKTGMGTGAKVGIALGVVVVVSLGAYLLTRKS